MGYDDIGDVRLVGIGGGFLVLQYFLEDGEVFVLPLAGVDEDVGVTFPDEIRICSWTAVRDTSTSNRHMRKDQVYNARLGDRNTALASGSWVLQVALPYSAKSRPRR